MATIAVTVQDSLDLLTFERLPLTINCSGVIPAGDTVSAPSCTISNNSTKETVAGAIVVAPIASSSTTIKVVISGGLLRAGQTYTLTTTFTSTNSQGNAKTLSVLTTLNIIR